MARWFWWSLGLAAGGLGLVPAAEFASRLNCYADTPEEWTALDIKALGDGLELYHYRSGRYPTPEEGLDLLVARGIYRQPLKRDPWGNPYRLLPPREAGGIPEIRSDGEDGKPGTDDDISSVPRERSCFLGVCL